MGVEDQTQVEPSTSQGKIDTASQTVPQETPTDPSAERILPSRCPFTQSGFDDIHLRRNEPKKPSVCSRIKHAAKCSRKRFWGLLCTYFPVLLVIRQYKIKQNTLRDIMGGISVGTLHFPQSLAFSMLASVKLENGLYTSMWPVLIYVVFGTSAHVSIGTSAVISIMTASIVDEKAEQWLSNKTWFLNQTQSENVTAFDDVLDFKERVASSVALITGAMLIGMSLLRLGFITAYFSISFFDAFTSAAAIHIATSQIPSILGINVQPVTGAGKLVKMYQSIFEQIGDTNIASLVIAVVCGVILWFVKDCINERYKSKMPVPIPIELFIVIGSTLASHYGNFPEEFDVPVVGSIPTGFSAPYFPLEGVDINGNDILGCFILAILIYIFTISIAKLCATKHGYEIDDGQEMLAYGLCNFCSSFFRCFPAGVAPPRSMVASSMNVASTFHGLATLGFMIFFTLIAAQWFSDLPKTVLAAIIIVALKNLYIQILHFRKYWHANKFDFVIWFFTFFSTVFLDIHLGLASGVAVSIITVIFQTQLAQGYKLGITLTDSWPVEHKRYQDSCELSGVKIFKFESSLYFANAEIFRRTLYRRTVDPKQVSKGLLAKTEEKRASGKEIAVETVDGDARKSMSAPELSFGEQDAVETVNEDDLWKMHELIKDDSPTPDISTSVDNVRKRVFTITDSRLPILTKLESDFMLLDSGRTTDLNARSEKTSGKTSPWVPSRVESPLSMFSFSFVDSSEETIDGETSEENRYRQLLNIHHVIIDCTSINYIDCSGANTLKQIYTEYNRVNIQLFLAGCSALMRQTMTRAGVFNTIPEDVMFLDVPDAIFYATSKRFSTIRPIETKHSLALPEILKSTVPSLPV